MQQGNKIMKYCKKCNLLIKDTCDNCTKCGKTLDNAEPSAKSPVVVVTASGFEKERICTILTDKDIPYSVRVVAKRGIPTEINAVAGNSKTEHEIIVPYEFYNKAMEQLVGINAVELDDGELQELTEALEKEDKSDKKTDADDYFSVKNRVIRILSAIAFFILVALVIFGVDAVMAIIKTFLT